MKLSNAEQIAAQLTAARKENASALDALAARGNELREEVVSKLARLKCELMMTEARYWKTEKVPSNELLTYLQLIEVAIKAQSGFHIERGIAEGIRLLKAGVKVDGPTVQEALEALHQLPPKYKIRAEALRALLAEV